MYHTGRSPRHLTTEVKYHNGESVNICLRVKRKVFKDSTLNNKLHFEKMLRNRLWWGNANLAGKFL